MQSLRRPRTAVGGPWRSITARQPRSMMAKRGGCGTFTTTPHHRAALPPPLNIPKWLSENSHLLRPPINNYCVYRDPMTVMVVGGPNARTDYHINPTPEFFYQHKGRMLLKTVQAIDGWDTFRDVCINEGEMFLLPGHTPHSPVRFADTVGVVIEQPRPEGSTDRLRWYCQNCAAPVHEASFHCTDLGTQIEQAVRAFAHDADKRTCGRCGHICDVAPPPDAVEAVGTAA